MKKSSKSKRERLLEKKNTKALVAPHRPSFYKDEDAYLNAVYKFNKEYIIAHKPKDTRATPRAFFKDEVYRAKKLLKYSGRNDSIRSAIKRAANSKMMNPGWEDSQVRSNNFANLLKKDKMLYREFRNQTREKGKFTKFDYSKVKFGGYYTVNGSNALMYKYDDVYIIEYKSPQIGLGASYEIWDKDQFDLALGKTIFYSNLK